MDLSQLNKYAHVVKHHPWLAGLSPDKKDPADYHWLMEQLYAIQYQMDTGELSIADYRLNTRESEVLVNLLEDFFQNSPVYQIQISNSEGLVDVNSLQRIVNIGVEFALSLFLEAPHIFGAWKQLVTSHDSLSWVKHNARLIQNWNPDITSLTLGAHPSDPHQKPFVAEENLDWLECWMFLHGFSKITGQIFQELIRLLTPNNPIADYVFQSQASLDNCLANAQKVYQVGHKFAVLYELLMQAKNLTHRNNPAIFIYPKYMEKLSQKVNWNTGLHAPVYGEHLAGFNSAYRFVMHDWQKTYNSLVNSSQGKLEDLNTLANLLEIPVSDPGLAKLLNEVLVREFFLLEDGWYVEPGQRNDINIPKSARAANVAAQMGWVNRFFDVEGRLLTRKIPVNLPFWNQRDEEVYQSGKMSALQTLDVFMLIESFTTEERHIARNLVEVLTV